MDLVTVFNAPRLVTFGADDDLKAYFVRAMSLEGMATVLAWLDDVIPGRVDRKMPPAFGSDEAQAALASMPGQKLLLYVALYDQGVSYAEACELFSVASDVQLVRMLEVLFAHRRTLVADSDGKDISETWLEENGVRLAEAIGLKELGSLSIDQFSWLASGGKLDENPAFSPERLAQAQVDFQAKWGDKLAALQIAPQPEGQG